MKKNKYIKNGEPGNTFDLVAGGQNEKMMTNAVIGIDPAKPGSECSYKVFFIRQRLKKWELLLLILAALGVFFLGFSIGAYGEELPGASTLAAPELPAGVDWGAAEDLARQFAHRLVFDVIKDATFHERVRVNLSLDVVKDATAQSLYIDPDEITFHISFDGADASIRANTSISLDPTDGGTASGVIRPATKLVFPYYTGPKIDFWGDAYSVWVEDYNLKFTSDRNLSFGSDEDPYFLRLYPDLDWAFMTGKFEATGDIAAHGDVFAGDKFRFTDMAVGDKIWFYSSTYAMGIAYLTLQATSDRYFSWGSDTHPSTGLFDGDTGTWYGNFFDGDGTSITNVNAVSINGATEDKFIWVDGSRRFSGTIMDTSGSIQLNPVTGTETSTYKRYTPVNKTLSEILATTQDGDSFFVRPPAGG